MFEDQIGYTNTYLLIGLVFLSLAAGIFIIRKDLRIEIIILTLLFLFTGLFVDPIYRTNYYIAEGGVLNFSINIGSVALAAGLGAFSSCIFDFIFTTKHNRDIITLKDVKLNPKKGIVPTGIILLFFVFTLVTSLNSLQAISLSIVLYMGILLFTRKDLLQGSIYTGGIVLFTMILINNIINLVSPGWFFKSQSLVSSPVIILNMTVDSIIFFFLMGAFVGTVFEYWQDLRYKQV